MLKYLVLFFVCFSTPVLAGSFPDDTIGSGFGVQVRVERTQDKDLSKISDMGFHYLRYDMHWHDVEKYKKMYDWKVFDAFIARLRANKLHSVIILNGTNPLYEEVVEVPGGYWGKPTGVAAPTKPESIKAFADFAAEAVKRYGTKDIIWEIWNEPDSSGFWPPKPDPKAFASLASQTCSKIRNVDATATVIAPAVAGLPNLENTLSRDFLGTFLQSPAGACIDYLSIHPYRLKDVPETALFDYEHKVIPFITKFTPDRKTPLGFVSGEWGYTTAKISKTQQAAFLLRTHLVNKLAHVPLTIWYEWKDSHKDGEKDVESNFGILDYEGNNTITADTINGILPKIKNAVIVKRLMDKDPTHFVVLIKQPDGKLQIIVWMATDEINLIKTLTLANASGAVHYKISAQPQLIDVGSDNPAFEIQ